jgi:hypothetical protein
MGDVILKYIMLPIIGAVCWRIGGSISKPVRRFFMPALMAIIAYCSEKSKLHKSWKILLILATAGGLSMGYGKDHDYPDRTLFCFCVIFPTFFLGFSIFQIIFPVIFLGGFYLSNTHNKTWLWKWHNLEVIFGFTYGLLISSFL